MGADVGVDAMSTCSDGRIVENPKVLTTGLNRLRRLDQAIACSRRAHGKSNPSHRREGIYVRRRNLHSRIVNVRNDNHHKVTAAIAKSAGRVVVETLNVAGMIWNRRLERALAETGMSGFLTRLEYKCRWFASSKLCAHCGWKNDDLMLSHRAWWCSGYGVLNDRDANAAKNLANWPGLRFSGVGRGDRVRPAVPAAVGETSRESMPEVWASARLDYPVSSGSR